MEVMHDLTVADFASFAAARRTCYDLIWIARTHNLDRVLHEPLADLVNAAAELDDRRRQGLASRTRYLSYLRCST